MVQAIDRLRDIADGFDAVVLDQWGVLHDGTAPYPGVPEALSDLSRAGIRLAVLSNSGKRAAVNAARIARIGYPEGLFDAVMTSGEAFWQDVAKGRVAHRRFLPITAKPGDAKVWAEGLDVTFVDASGDAEAVLLMGLPEGSDGRTQAGLLQAALAPGLPVYCTNPDRASPRAGGGRQVSPGALAHAHAEAGGTVQFYGKPHPAVFEALAGALDAAPERLLMVGDSLEHDIAGAKAAGWSALFVQGGLHAADFAAGAEPAATAASLATAEAAPPPDFTLYHVR